MPRRKVSFGILIVLGFALVAITYFIVMSSTAEIFGTVRVESQLVSWEENPPGLEDMEMVAVNGYCIKGPDTDNRMLLSTKNKQKSDRMKYSFVAKEGMRNLILVYMQLDHLTGAAGQNLELHFLTDEINKGDLKRNFAISFELVEGVDGVRITVAGTGYDKPKVFQYPLSAIPDTIQL